MPSFLRFTDRAGGRWRVYEFSITAGITHYVRPGDRASQYRGFAPDPADGRARRRVLLFRPEERRLEEPILQLQFELSFIDPRDDPTHPYHGASRR